jgi:hypothetical protein
MKIFRGRLAIKVLLAALVMELVFGPLLWVFPESTLVLAVVVVLNLPAEIFFLVVQAGTGGKLPLLESRNLGVMLAITTAGVTAVTWAALADFLFRSKDAEES